MQDTGNRSQSEWSSRSAAVARVARAQRPKVALQQKSLNKHQHHEAFALMQASEGVLYAIQLPMVVAAVCYEQTYGGVQVVLQGVEPGQAAAFEEEESVSKHLQM